MKAEAEIRGMQPQTKEAGSHWKLEEQNDPPPEPPEGPWPCQHLRGDSWPPDSERINFSCFKLPSLQFVTASIRN